MSERNSCHMVRPLSEAIPRLGGQPPPSFLWGPFALWVLGMVVNDPGSLGPARLVRQASSQVMADHGKCRTSLTQKDQSSMGQLQGTLTGIAIQVSEYSPRRKGVLEAVVSLRSCVGFLTVPGSQEQQLGNTGQSTGAWSFQPCWAISVLLCPGAIALVSDERPLGSLPLSPVPACALLRLRRGMCLCCVGSSHAACWHLLR